MKRRVMTLGALLLASSAFAGPKAKYHIVDIEAISLGTLGGSESVANDINDLGEIVGWAHTASGAQRAFVYQNGVMADLTPVTGMTSEARGINDLTRVVGAYRQTPLDVTHAFYWRQGFPLQTLDESAEALTESGSCATGASAEAINDSGVITGIRRIGCDVSGPPPDPPSTRRSVRWQSFSASWQDLLPDIPTHNWASNDAHDISQSGVIVGEELGSEYSFTGDYVWEPGEHAWGPGSVHDLPFPDATPPAWYYPSTARAFGINDASKVVGQVELKPDGIHASEIVTRAYFWDNDSNHALGLLPTGQNSAAYDLNNQDFIVGYADRKPQLGALRNRAVIWHADIGVTELPLPPGIPPMILNKCVARAVNDRKIGNGVVQAVGYCNVTGVRKAVLWNITTTLTTDAAPAAKPRA